MKRRQLARIKTVEGKRTLQFVSKTAFISDLNDFQEDERVWIQVESYRRQRSLKQNAVIHWYFQEISEETGLEMEIVKETLKKKFLTVVVNDKNGDPMVDNDGEVMTRVQNTSELTTVGMMEFSEQVRLWAVEFLGLLLPEPEQQSELKLK